jgi:hypothetical protein
MCGADEDHPSPLHATSDPPCHDARDNHQQDGGADAVAHAAMDHRKQEVGVGHRRDERTHQGEFREMARGCGGGFRKYGLDRETDRQSSQAVAYRARHSGLMMADFANLA